MPRRDLWAFFVAGFLALTHQAVACTADKMKTTESGFIYKVVGGSDRVEAKIKPGGKETAFVLELLAPYFVICEEDQLYKVTDLHADTVNASIRKGRATIQFGTMNRAIFGFENIITVYLAAMLARDAAHIAHIQVADVPDRGAPGTGVLDYEALFRQIAAQGYPGRIGCDALAKAAKRLQVGDVREGKLALDLRHAQQRDAQRRQVGTGRQLHLELQELLLGPGRMIFDALDDGRPRVGRCLRRRCRRGPGRASCRPAAPSDSGPAGPPSSSRRTRRGGRSRSGTR